MNAFLKVGGDTNVRQNVRGRRQFDHYGETVPLLH